MRLHKYHAETPVAFHHYRRHFQDAGHTGWIQHREYDPFRNCYADRWAVFLAGREQQIAYSEQGAREMLARPTALTTPVWLLVACLATLRRGIQAAELGLRAMANGIDAKIL